MNDLWKNMMQEFDIDIYFTKLDCQMISSIEKLVGPLTKTSKNDLILKIEYSTLNISSASNKIQTAIENLCKLNIPKGHYFLRLGIYYDNNNNYANISVNLPADFMIEASKLGVSLVVSFFPCE